MVEKRVGYLVDQSHPPLVFAAVQGLGEVLEHGLRELETLASEVSPIVLESRHRLVVINLYEPEPISIQVVQHAGHLERMTEILGAGVGMGVLRELRNAATALDLELGPITPRFRNRIEKEIAVFAKAFALFKGDGLRKQSSLTQVLQRFQEKYRRECRPSEGAGPSERGAHPSLGFRQRLPKAVGELERSIEDVLTGTWDRAVLGHAREVASALAQACRTEGLWEAARLSRSIASLVSVSPDILRTVENAFRDKITRLLGSLKDRAEDALSDTGS
jgi:hypothetical protein